MNRFLQYRPVNKRRYDDGSPIGLPPELLAQLANEQQLVGQEMPPAIGGHSGVDPAMLQQLMAQQQPVLSATSVPEESAVGMEAIRNIDEGGLHEENPLEGVPIGKDEEGVQNLVEEGEVIYKDFVFSNRIPIDKRLIEPFNLSPSFAGKTYAQVAKKIQDEASERPNDAISQRGLDAMMGNLRVAQEAQKRREEMEKRFKELRQSSNADESMNAEAAALSEQIDDFDSNPRGFIEAMEQQNQAIEQEVELAKQAQSRMVQEGINQQQVDPNQIQAAQEQGSAPQDIDPAMLQQLMAQQGAVSGGQGDVPIDPSILGLAYGGLLKNDYRRFSRGGDIHIKEENKGKFTESAKRAGMGIQEYARKILANKEKYSNTLIRRANFARNARKWEDGGDKSRSSFGEFLSNNAPTFIKAAQTLQSLQNLRDAHKSPNYYTAEMLRDAANKQMGYSLAGFSPVTTRMKARTVDPMMTANRLSSEARANRAAIMNLFRGNRGAIANALLANAYNTQRGISDAYNQGVLTNNQALAQAAQINQATEQANAQLGAQISSTNAQVRQNALSKYAATMAAAADKYRELDEARQNRIDAAQKSWNSTLDTWASDLYNYNTAKSDPALDYYTNLNGIKKHKEE